MSEQQATPGPAAPSAAVDDDDLIDVLDAGDEDLDDGDFDLDDESLALDDSVIVQVFVPDDVADVAEVDPVDIGDIDVDVDVDVDFDADDDAGIEEDLLGPAALLEAT